MPPGITYTYTGKVTDILGDPIANVAYSIVSNIIEGGGVVTGSGLTNGSGEFSTELSGADLVDTAFVSYSKDNYITQTNIGGVVGEEDVVFPTTVLLYDGILPDPISDLIDAIEAKLKPVSFITDVNNVMWGEKAPHKHMGMEDTEFPRIEILAVAADEMGYVDQYSVNESFFFSVLGIIKRDDIETTSRDLKDIVNFGTECKRALRGFNKDSQTGSAPCKGFLMVGDKAKLIFEYELYDKLTSFELIMEIKYDLNNAR